MTTELAVPSTSPHPGALHERARRAGLDRFEIAVLAAFAAVSLWVLALDLWQVAVHHRYWTGTDGLFLADQMQYLAWIQDASRHFLISNMFVLRPTPYDYFQPIAVISGALVRLGVAAWLTLLVWKPVAVLAAFFGVRAYVHRSLRRRFDRRAALVLALFFASWTVIGDEWMPFWTWGYPFGLLAIAAVAGALVSYDRARAAARFTPLPAALGLLASLVHPWQGELLILVVVGAEAAGLAGGEGMGLRRRLPLAGATILGTALPLLYYEALYRFDPGWHGAQQASKHAFPLAQIVVPLIPLLVVAALAYRRRPARFIDAATRAWPFAALAIYGLSETGISGTPLHAWAGITIPLAVLAVQGAQSIGLRRLPHWRLAGAALVAAATIPAGVAELRLVRYYVAPARFNANFISAGDRRALRYLATAPQPGGVLARQYIGLIVPALTGRHTYVGSGQWSGPDRPVRVQNTIRLLSGGDSPALARAFVRSTGARFVLEDCNSHAALTRALGPMIASVRRFGCAAVYRIR